MIYLISWSVPKLNIGMASSIINMEDDGLDFNVSGKLILRLSCRSLLERAISDGSSASLFPSCAEGEVCNCS